MVVVPYAVTSIEEILERPFYEEIIEKEVLYGNLKKDGILDVPAHLCDVHIEFEQSYVNLHYQRLGGAKQKTRSVSGALDHPVYDLLNPFTALVENESRGSLLENTNNPIQNVTERGGSHSLRISKSIDLGQLYIWHWYEK